MLSAICPTIELSEDDPTRIRVPDPALAPCTSILAFLDRFRLTAQRPGSDICTSAAGFRNQMPAAVSAARIREHATVRDMPTEQFSAARPAGESLRAFREEMEMGRRPIFQTGLIAFSESFGPVQPGDAWHKFLEQALAGLDLPAADPAPIVPAPWTGELSFSGVRQRVAF